MQIADNLKVLGNISATGSVTASTTEQFNISAVNFPNLRAAYANMRLGSVDPIILMLGDSTMGGYNSTFVAKKSFATPRYLGQILTAAGIPASEEAGNIGAGADMAFTWDTRITNGTNWNLFGSNPIGLGGQYFSSNTNGATISFTPVRQFDSFDVYRTDSTVGAFTANVDGGSSLGTSTGLGTQNVVKATFTCTLGTHTINVVQANTTSSYINLILAHTSGARQFNIINEAWGGAFSSYFLNSPSSFFGAGNAVAWAALKPALVIIELTINETINNIAVATFTANIQALISLAQGAGCDVLLSSGNPVNNSSGITNIPSYILALRQLAASNNCGLIEMNQARYVSYAVTNPIFPYFDTLHPGLAGTMDKAFAYAAAIQAGLA